MAQTRFFLMNNARPGSNSRQANNKPNKNTAAFIPKAKGPLSQNPHKNSTVYKESPALQYRLVLRSGFVYGIACSILVSINPRWAIWQTPFDQLYQPKRTPSG